MTIRRVLLALPLLLMAWIAIMAGVMRFSDAAPAAVVILPAAGFTTRLPPGTAIIGAGPFHLTLRSDTPGLGRHLYAAGARLVLPAGLTGCLPLPATAAKPGA